MANPKFKIGDRVKIHSGRGVANIAYVSSMDTYCGETAIISNVIISSNTRVFYELKGKPFNWHESLLEAVKNENKIVITTDGTTTRAALYDGHKLIREAKAICSKYDTFNFETGAKIAIDRLTEKPAEPKPKKELKPLNTKVFIIDGYDDFKSGHIYEIKDGKIIDNDGWEFPLVGIFYNMNDVQEYFNGSHDTKYNAVGEALNRYTTVKQIKVMEVKEG